MSNNGSQAVEVEEDEFEEFMEDDWPVNKQEDKTLWDTEWDKEEVDEVFAAKLNAEIQQSASSTANNAAE
eukprot:763001-Hanusia_phi.AAC.3